MFAPVIRKLIEKEESFIERCLPVAGIIESKEGDIVKPFDRLGECTYSQKETKFPASFKPLKFTAPKKYYFAGEIMGKSNLDQVTAPYNGDLILGEDKTFIFNETERRYTLLSGVWGTVQKVVPNKSVLIKTQTKDLLLAACTPTSVAGELVVFPNPVDLLEKYYLESFQKSNEGKIIYVGHFAGLELAQRAHEMGAVALIAGSANRETLKFAKDNGLGMGLISGFGKLQTPEEIFKFLSVIAHRYVFFEGEKNILRVPNSPEIDNSKPITPTIQEKQEVEKDTLKNTKTTKTKKTSVKSGKSVKSAKTKSSKTTKTPKTSRLSATLKVKKGQKEIVDDSAITTIVSTEKAVIKSNDPIKEVVKGIDVQVFQDPHYAKIGIVDSVSETSIFVRFDKESDPVEILIPNFFIVE